MKRVAIRVLTIAVMIAVGLGAATARAIWEGRAALAAGDKAMAHGDRAGAIAAWREAAGWAAPLGDHVEVATARLAGVGLDRGASEPPASAAWVALALLGLGLIVAGAVHFARRGLGPGDRLIAREAGGAGALVALGLILWLVGLHQA
ncbi:MAG: hypothetical protein K8W52_11650 [Deltaproteobacteria bacterium]|nr:hypothetical protein [Deltaproteobacteria bacterium]